MLADSIEASVRSIEEKNYVNIEKMVRKIINSKMESSQLIETNLTFGEIEILIESFVKTLVSIYHLRIKYPEEKKKK